MAKSVYVRNLGLWDRWGSVLPRFIFSKVRRHSGVGGFSRKLSHSVAHGCLVKRVFETLDRQNKIGL